MPLAVDTRVPYIGSHMPCRAALPRWREAPPHTRGEAARAAQTFGLRGQSRPVSRDTAYPFDGFVQMIKEGKV